MTRRAGSEPSALRNSVESTRASPFSWMATDDPPFAPFWAVQPETSGEIEDLPDVAPCHPDSGISTIRIFSPLSRSYLKSGLVFEDRSNTRRVLLPCSPMRTPVTAPSGPVPAAGSADAGVATDGCVVVCVVATVVVVVVAAGAIAAAVTGFGVGATTGADAVSCGMAGRLPVSDSIWSSNWEMRSFVVFKLANAGMMRA